MRGFACFTFAAVLYCGSSVFAGESVTYGDDPGEKSIEWVNSYAVIGATGSDSEKSDSIAGNTVTVKNVIVPLPEEPTYPSRDIQVYGAVNSIDSEEVTGNTVVIENSILEHDLFHDYVYEEDPNDPSTFDRGLSEVYGGYAGGYNNVRSFNPNIPPYTAVPVANNNHVKIDNSAVGSVTGGYAGRYDPSVNAWDPNYNFLVGNPIVAQAYGSV